MNWATYRSALQKMHQHRNGYLLLACGLMLLNILLIILSLSLAGRERIILTPPTIEHSFWVNQKSVSPEYLAEMSTFFIGLRCTVTTSNAALQREILLRYTDPRFYESLKTTLVQEALQLSKNHVSTAFYPVSIKVDEKHFLARVSGDLVTMVGSTTLPTQRVMYQIQYRYDTGRLWVSAFEEIKAHA
jgi:conjugal transfer pilus assembly protein TraE